MQTTQNLSTQPLVTFIVTAYNLPTTWLCACLESILALPLRPEEREIIMVDDGSDLTALDALAQQRDQLVYLRQRNQGPSAARNAGLRLAQGQYIQFVDGDDCLIPPVYEHCLDIIQQQEADIVLFHTTPTAADSEAANGVALQVEGPMTGVSYMHNNNLRSAACGYLFKRAILGTLRYTVGLLNEDEEFTPKLMLRAEQLYSTNCRAYYYRQHAESSTHKQDAAHVNKRLADTMSIILHLQSLAQSGPEIDRVALQRRIAQLSMDHLYNTIRLTHSSSRLNEAIDQLREHGLFPLPAKNYTKRYTTFRRLVNNVIGRRLLLLAIK